MATTEGKRAETMTYNVFIQYPRPRSMGPCCVALDKSGSALLMDAAGEKALADMERARVDWMQAAGMMISGFEHTGVDRTGRAKYRLQEWYCGYVPNNERTDR